MIFGYLKSVIPGYSFTRFPRKNFKSYGNIDTNRFVDGTVPAEHEVTVDTGFMSFDAVTAVMRKAGAGAGELGVGIVVYGGVVKQTSTTAEYGVATLTWSPTA